MKNINLWKTFNYGGNKQEPFLINPVSDLMLINPKRKRKRGGSKMKRRKTSKRAKRRSLSVTGRRGSLRVASGSRLAPSFARRGTMINPFATNRRIRRRVRRNPAISIPLAGRFDIPAIPELAGGIAGFVAVKSIPSMIFPANWQVGLMRVASQGITTIASSLLASRFLGKRFGKMVLTGGLIAMGTELVGQLLVKMGVPLGLYLQPQDMGYYMTEQEQAQ